MKFVRKLLLGMAVFVILILIEVQATDINSTTFKIVLDTKLGSAAFKPKTSAEKVLSCMSACGSKE